MKHKAESIKPHLQSFCVDIFKTKKSCFKTGCELKPPLPSVSQCNWLPQIAGAISGRVRNGSSMSTDDIRVAA